MKELQTIIPGSYSLEKTFTTAWLKTLKDKGFYTDKISDSSVGMKKVDCYIATPWFFYPCEIKLVNNDKLPLKRISGNQWSALTLNIWLWHRSIIVVYSKKYNNYKIIPFEKIMNLDRNGHVKLIFDNKW